MSRSKKVSQTFDLAHYVHDAMVSEFSVLLTARGLLVTTPADSFRVRYLQE